MMKVNSLLLAAASACAVTIAAPATAQVVDDFNRADATTLGSNWTQQVGTSFISGNQAGGRNSALATYNGGASQSITFDISETSAGVDYVAAVFGYGSGSDFYIKVQDNGPGGFGNYGFYTGNGSGAGGQFGSLSSAFTSGSVTASYVGNLATLVVTPTGGAAQTYTYTYGFTPGSTSVGLGFLGNGRADNFALAPLAASVPEPAMWAMMILGMGAIGFAMRRQKVTTRVSYAA